jgi:hypothetical protein
MWHIILDNIHVNLIYFIAWPRTWRPRQQQCLLQPQLLFQWLLLSYVVYLPDPWPPSRPNATPKPIDFLVWSAEFVRIEAKLLKIMRKKRKRGEIMRNDCCGIQ